MKEGETERRERVNVARSDVPLKNLLYKEGDCVNPASIDRPTDQMKDPRAQNCSTKKKEIHNRLGKNYATQQKRAAAADWA